MKILHLSAVKNWGGGENQIEVLCQTLKQKKPEVSNVILCVKNSQFHQKLKFSELNFETAALNFKSDPAFIFKIISLCKKQRVNLVHIHDPTALMLAVMAGRLVKLPPFIFSKKTSFPIKPRKQSLYKYNYKNIKKILCVSETTKNITAPAIKNPEKLQTLYHGIDLESCAKTDTAFSLHKHLNISKETLVFGNIANHIPAKNLEILIAAANELIHKHCRKNVHFVQIGNYTKQTPMLKKMVQNFQLENHFSFLNFRKKASAFIPQFDFSVLSSQSEGLPQFIYESFYHKIPVISTDVGGISEVITHKENGVLSPAHDEKKLCENMLFLMDNAECIPKFAEKSFQILIKGFTAEIMAKNTLEVYKNLLDERL